MKVLTKYKEYNIKLSVMFRFLFFKFKDKQISMIEDYYLPRKLEIKTPIKEKEEPVTSTLSINDKDDIARNFYKYRPGQSITVGGRSYKVMSIPRIDYQSTYLPFFMLERNNFIEKL